MRAILDQPDPTPESNYQKWSLRFFLYALVMTVAQLVIKQFFNPALHNLERYTRNFQFYLLLLWSCILISSYFLYKSHQFQEERNIPFWISAVGIPTLLMFRLLL